MGPHTGKEAALQLLLEQPGRLEPGLVVLDRRLPLDESVEVDALLRDSLGYPVVVLFTRGDIAPELERMAAVAASLQRGRFLLARLYQGHGLDAALRPRFVLLGTRFADHDAALLDMMSGVEVHALEYRVVTGGGVQPVLDLASFHRTSGPSLVKGGWRGAELSPPSAAPLPPPGASAGLSASSASATPAAPGAMSGPHGGAHEGPPGMRGGGAPGGALGGALDGVLGGALGGALGGSPGGTAGGAHAGVSGGTHGGALGATTGASAGSHAGSATAPAAPAAGTLAASAGFLGAAGPSGGRFGQLERVGAEELHLLHEDLAKPELARSYFLRARDSIRSLSSHVSENAEQGSVRYHVRGAPLATLGLDSTGFHMQVGDAAGPGLRVADEASFNERLNAVFTLYFNHLGPDRPTA